MKRQINLFQKKEIQNKKALKPRIPKFTQKKEMKQHHKLLGIRTQLYGVVILPILLMVLLGIITYT